MQWLSFVHLAVQLFASLLQWARMRKCLPASGRHIPRHTMSGLYAYFRSDRTKRLASRKDGLHRFFGLSSGEDTSSSSSRPTPVPSNVVDEDVLMAISSENDSAEEEPPHKIRRGLSPAGDVQGVQRLDDGSGFQAGLYRLPVLHITKLSITESAADTMVKSCFEQGAVTWMQLEAIMSALPDEPKMRWKQETNQDMATPKSFMTGAWARGPQVGLTRNLKNYPQVSRLLAHILRGVDPNFQFSSCTMARNVSSKPHRDSYNAEGSWNLVVPCSSYQGGEVWVQHEAGATWLSPQGEPGTLWDTHTPLRFDPKQRHATAPWGGDRLVLIGYHVRHISDLSVEDAELLRQLGFVPNMSTA